MTSSSSASAAGSQLKRGGDRMRLDASLLDLPAETRDATRVLEIADALDRLRAVEPERADLVLLRHFGGLSCEELADILGISVATANRRWRFARAWLAAELDPGP
jgi:DNA-directed RNA polymerase specialized sigma24 family protein